MSLGFSLAIRLGAGLHADSGPPIVKLRFQAGWGKTEVFVSHPLAWDLTRVRAWRHEASWSVRLALRHQTPYGLRVAAAVRASYGELRRHRRQGLWPYGETRQHRIRQRAGYGDAARVQARVIWRYGERPLLRAAHRIGYGDALLLRLRHLTPYRGLLAVALRHALGYADATPLRGRHVLAYRDVSPLRRRHLATYKDLSPCRSALSLPYWLTHQNHAQHRLAYAVHERSAVAGRLTASWALLDDARLQAVDNTPELVWAGRTVPILQATLSCDEDSPVWMAQIVVAALADFAAIGLGDTLTLALGAEHFTLVVDGKTLSRSAVAEQRIELSAVSPLALLDAPFAGAVRRFEAGAVSACAAVEGLIGAVDWQLPDWIIPPGRLMLDGATPLAAARNLVAAIGGIVESQPDGSVLCRRRHPVRIPQYGEATVAHSLFDADVLSAQAQIAPMRGFDRVTIANEEGQAGPADDRIEYLLDPADGANARQGRVRVTLSSPRPVQLVHTGHPSTEVQSLGAITRTEVETVEFIEGRASTRYPVTQILNLTWQHRALGDVSAGGQVLTAATPGYSLLRITYTTTSLDWRVALPLDEEVQFVLVDA